jgi:hypothetical protein
MTAIIDACVLYSAPVRDLVIRLAQGELVRARWTVDIHDEWMRNGCNRFRYKGAIALTHSQ